VGSIPIARSSFTENKRLTENQLEVNSNLAHLRYRSQLGQRKAHPLCEGERFAPLRKSDQDHEVSFRALLG
jgi:hypothetical protein